MEVGDKCNLPATLTPVMTRYPLHRSLVGPHGRCGRVRNNSPLLGFDPRTVQSVASRYTDYDIPARNISSCVCVCMYIYVFMYVYITVTVF